MDKASDLTNLVLERRNENRPGYRHLHEFDQGKWDCDFVVPWTKSACNLDASLMIIGQDWASERFLSEPRYNTPKRIEGRTLAGQDEYLPTNRRLKALLKQHFGLSFSDTYATNVLVFIKRGKMTSNVPMKDMLYCANRYTLPQMKAVQPVMAMYLGAKTFNSVRRAMHLSELKLCEPCEPSAHTVYRDTKTEIYGVPHTGGLGQANAGGIEKGGSIMGKDCLSVCRAEPKKHQIVLDQSAEASARTSH